MNAQRFHLILHILLAVFLVGTGSVGLISFYAAPESMDIPEGPGRAFFEAVIATGWLFQWVAFFKVVAGIAMLIPRTRAVAVLAAVPYAVNIFLWTLFGNPGDLPMGAIVLILTSLLVRSHWEVYAPIFRSKAPVK
jgi:hypothetical protein